MQRYFSRNYTDGFGLVKKKAVRRFLEGLKYKVDGVYNFMV